MSLLIAVTDETYATEPTHRDVLYAKVGDHRLLLDIYQPKGEPSKGRAEERPLIVWVHGGAWRSGSKSSVPIRSMLDHGFAIAGVDYRLSPVAKFPAQIHDIKAAIRFLRARAARYEFDEKRFVVAGASAGGHLAALVGVSNGVAELEGTVGDHRKTSSHVQAAVSFYGASNLTSILSQSTPHGLSVRVQALDLLLGGSPKKFPKLARLASPVQHVDAKDPPLWLIHGDADPQMPIEQSHELEKACKKARAKVELEAVRGAMHGGPEFYTSERLEKLAGKIKTAWRKIPGRDRK